MVGEALAGEDRGPFLEGQVGGDEGGAVLVALARHVEQQLASGLRKRDVSELIDDEEADLGEQGLEAEQPIFVARFYGEFRRLAKWSPVATFCTVRGQYDLPRLEVTCAEYPGEH